MLTADVGVGFYLIDGEFVVVEVIAPLEEAYDIILIHLHTDGTVTPGGHSDQSVRHAYALTAAVIGPEVLYVIFNKGLDMIVAGDGKINDSHLEEVVIGQSIHNYVAIEKIGDRILSRLIGLDMLKLGLIRNVEEATLIVAVFLHMRDEFHKEGAKETNVFLARRLRLPAEDLLILSVYGRHNLGSVLCAPLGKEVRYLKILDTDPVAHIDPSVEKVEVEGVFPVLNGNFNELICESLAANLGVEWGSEYGSQEKVDAVFIRHPCEVFDDFPVLFTPNGYVVVVSQGVAMEPLGEDEILLGEDGVNNVYSDDMLTLYLAGIVYHLDL